MILTKSDMSLEEISYKIIGCGAKVHNALDTGFQEVIYQCRLAVEMERANLAFRCEHEQTTPAGKSDGRRNRLRC